MNNQKSITDAFNTYFLSVDDNIINNKTQDYSLDEDNNISKDISVHFLSQTLHILRALSRKLVPFANIVAAALRSWWCTCMPSLLILFQSTDAICSLSNSVYTSCCVFIMFKKIENPAACEMRSVICFLNAKNMKSAEIHRQLCDVYGEHVMSSSMVRRWVRMFNKGRKNVLDNPRSGWPSVVNEDLVRAVEEKIRENRWFTITSLCLHFPQISQSLLYKIVSDELKFRKLCTRWVPKMLTEKHKLKRQASALDFLTRYSEEGDNFLSRVVQAASFYDEGIQKLVQRYDKCLNNSGNYVEK